jgi:hypothetical protein
MVHKYDAIDEGVGIMSFTDAMSQLKYISK